MKPSEEKNAVTLSETANKHILDCLAKNPASQGIRLSVKKTGCSGLSYVVDYVETSKDSDYCFKQTDNYWIFIDQESFSYLIGLHIDYVKQGLNKKFVFINPNQTGQCGCGESFTVDTFSS